MPTISPSRWTPAPIARHAALAACLALALCACGGPAPDAAGEPPRLYDVQGLVRQVAGPHELLVRHEPIHDFVDNHGEVVGMDSMTMPFPVSEEIDLSAIAPGDKIVFRLQVDWEDEAPARIVAVEKLSADTQLDWGKAEPPD